MSDKMKAIPQQKLKAFSIGNMGKRNMSKKEMEEQRKKEEEKAAAHAFQQFVETFQETPINGSSKVWVKAGTYDAGARKEDTRDKGKLYKPTSRLSSNESSQSSAEQAQAYAKFLINDRKPDRLGKKKPSSKSNLESFKEELRQIQEEREERHKYKGMISSKAHVETELDMFIKSGGEAGSFDNGDPSTTNLYLGNLNPKITEQQLMEVFGRFGPLASIKIMWPRSDEEKSRGRNCGFVAYMARKDGERALRNLNGKDVLGYEMKLGWGKAVVIPALPIYIPTALLEMSLPPPPSGLPFNAQPQIRDKDVLPKSQEELHEILSRSIIKVVAPNDRNLLMLIHRMVEFVVREGPMFEAMIMNREMHNTHFRFLFENQSPPHIYYRWKIYSIMHGDSQKEWTTKDFKMFRDGSIWKPPLMNNYTTGMPDELIHDEEDRHTTKGSLSNTQRDRLEDLIRNLAPESKKIGEAMVFCIEHSDAADEVADCILESMSNESTAFVKKISRLYLISDILHNCSVKVMKASYYRRAFEARLPDIIKFIKVTYDKLESRLKADGFRIRVLRTMKTWEDIIFSKHYMDKLRNIYMGIEEEVEEEEEEKPMDIDGNPLEQLDDDETPMDGAALLKTAMKQIRRSMSPAEVDYDGEAINLPDLIDASATSPSSDNGKSTALGGIAPPTAATAGLPPTTAAGNPAAMSGFIKSKWETVDPEQIEAQAMTTSKWELLDSQNNADTNSLDGVQIDDDAVDYADTRALTEERRTRLREIEVKAVQYQDELEAGGRSIKSGWTVGQQVEHYRRKLLRKADKEHQQQLQLQLQLAKDAASKEKDRDKDGGGGGSEGGKGSKHKRDYDEVAGRESSEESGYFKDITSRKHKKHARSSSSGSASKHRSKSRSPVAPTTTTVSSSSRSSKRSGARIPSPPSPPRIRRTSPSSSSKSSSHRSSSRRANHSPSSPPPPTVSSRSRTSRHSYSPSTSPYASASTTSTRTSSSRRSPDTPTAPTSSSSSSGRKHKHKRKS